MNIQASLRESKLLGRERLITGAIVAALIILAALAFRRLFFGVDFSDEGFYAALPYILALGQRPFVDELAIQQTTGIVLAPAVKLYLSVTGGSQGLVLFLRCGFFLSALGVGGIAFRSLRGRVSVLPAVLAASLPCLFFPFSIPSLGYNTTGSLLFAAACWSAEASVRASREFGETSYDASLLSVLGGLALATASFCYPTLVVPAFAMIIALLYAATKRRDRRSIRNYLAGAALGGIGFAATLLSIGWKNLHEAIAFDRDFGHHGGGVEKWVSIWSELFRHLPAFVVDLPEVIPALLAVLLIKKLRPLLAPLFLVSVVWITGRSGANFAIIYLALAAPLPFLVSFYESKVLESKDDELIHHIMKWVWFPSLLAGFTYSWTSDNGFVNSCFGLLPGAMVSVLVSALVVGRSPYLAVRSIGLVVLLLIPALFVRSSYRFVYGSDGGSDGPGAIGELTETVQDGPYAGLHTKPGKIAFLRELEAALQRWGAGQKSILFFDHFPAGYLFTTLRPATRNIWHSNSTENPRFDHKFYTTYYDADARRLPDVVFRLEKAAPDSSSVPRDVFWDYFNRPDYQQVLALPAYTAWVHHR